MSRVAIDAMLRAKLNGCNEQIELCDEAGSTLGHYVPAHLYRKLVHAYAEAQCPYTPEELAQFRQETGGSTLAEIWQKLGQA